MPAFAAQVIFEKDPESCI